MIAFIDDENAPFRYNAFLGAPFPAVAKFI